MIAIPKDEMTPKERMDAFGRGEEIDRVPCCPLLESLMPLILVTL